MKDKPRSRQRNSGMLADIIAYDGDKSALYAEIGRFVFEFSLLEATLRRILRRKLKLHVAYKDIMTAGFDFAKLVTAVLAASALEEGGKPEPALQKLLNRCHDINALRVAVVHGQWSSTLGGDSAYHVTRGSMTQKRFFEYEGDLDAASDEIVKLRDDINAAISRSNERRNDLPENDSGSPLME